MWWVKTKGGHEYPFISGYKNALEFFHKNKGLAIYWEPSNA